MSSKQAKTVANERENGIRARLEILDFVEKHYSKLGVAPTYREIAKACGISSTSVVSYHINIMIERGLLKRVAPVARGIIPQKEA